MALNLASLSLLPKAQSVLANLFRFTGGGLVQDLLTKTTALLNDVATNADGIAQFNVELKAFVAIFGVLVPGGQLKELEDEILKFETTVQSLASGQPVQVAELSETIGGQAREFVLLIQEKPASPPVSA